MPKLRFITIVLLLAVVAMASHECTHDPPGGGCVNHPRWAGDGSDQTCVGSGAHLPPPTPPPTWSAQPYGSHVPHVGAANVIPVMLTHDVFAWDPDWAVHYANAVGFWNDNLNNAVFHNVNAIDDARVWFVRPGGDDEQAVNAFLATQNASFQPSNSCTAGSAGAWATVNFAKPINYSGHWHYEYQKVCLWGSTVPSAPKSLNPYGHHRWWLTILHELGHVLSMDHMLPGQCVMLSGYAMIHPCASEIEWVNQHYGL